MNLASNQKNKTLDEFRLNYLFKMSKTASMAQALFVPLITTFVYSFGFDPIALIIWNILIFSAILVRYLSAKYFLNKIQQTPSLSEELIQKSINHQSILLFVTSLLWGAVFVMTFHLPENPHNDAMHITSTSFAVGMIAVSISSIGSVKKVFLSFSLPMSIILIALFLNEGGFFHDTTAIILLVGLAMLIASRQRFSEQFDQAILHSQTIEKNEFDLINRLAKASEFRDEETGNHIKRMSYNCYLLAKEIQLPKDKIKLIRQASSLHDVGKIGISDTILLKPGSFTQEEREIMNQHPIIGAKILENSDSKMIQMAKTIAEFHHEKYDGTGYPNGLKAKDIPIEARIAAICDVYDALTSERPYKQPWPHKKALAHIIENSGTHFDPELVDAFMKIYPQIIDYAQQHQDALA